MTGNQLTTSGPKLDATGWALGKTSAEDNGPVPLIMVSQIHASRGRRVLDRGPVLGRVFCWCSWRQQHVRVQE